MSVNKVNSDGSLTKIAGGAAEAANIAYDNTDSGLIASNVQDAIDEIAEGGVQSDWTEADSTSDAYILHKPNLATVATSGDYDDLSNTPTGLTSAQVNALINLLN